MNNFKKLKIWQAGMNIVTQTYEIADKLSSDERFGLRSQITRSAVSIPSNIAEGTSRTSQKDFARFLEISLGSCFELETQLLNIKKNKLAEDLLLDEAISSIHEEQKMIFAFTKKVKSLTN